MDIRQIEFFVAVAEELNFTRAAELTYVTQSGLSSSIRGLERELNTQLFDRTPRAVALTPAGHAFLPHARRMLHDARAALRELAEDSPEGALSVGSEQCLGDLVDLPELIASFHMQFPGVTLRFEQLGTQAVFDQLLRGELNAAFLAQPGAFVTPMAGQKLDSFEVAREDFELVLASGHPLASRDEVTWPDLEKHPFVDFDVTWTARRIVDAAFATRRLVRRVAFTVNDMSMLMELVHKGLGIALVPAPLAGKPEAEGLVRRPFPEPDLEWVVHFVTTEDSGPPVRLLSEMVFTSEVLAATRQDIGAEIRKGPSESAGVTRTGSA
ncbi:LysR family transcriptional regulator [Actinoallomurus purpureus]|uniref:LysR family transcriptional regulator n=1 Tax=Actinoallomurus purpureus TaxID=478114 RepID=UPI0020923EEE|nr:LysR family transcriptional regulator [Actinoallomurus purpureus]MCO6005348.1 LysR family transcriptional regulator [Actinoallomurus purpureus]